MTYIVILIHLGLLLNYLMYVYFNYTFNCTFHFDIINIVQCLGPNRLSAI